MPIELVWSRQALDDLEDIYTLIGLDNRAAAERYFERVTAKVELLRSQPRLGMSRPDIRPGLRMLVEAPYLVLYRIEPDSMDAPVRAVQIVRVLDGRRDLPSLF